MIDRLRYMGALFSQALKAAATNYGQFLFLSAGMFVQNAIFFIVWVIFFGAVHDVHGWGLKEIALFQGVLCLGIGSGFFLAEGSRSLADTITSGSLDIYLVRPRHPLPQVLTLQSSAWSMGDIIYGLCLMVLIGHPGLQGFVMGLVIAACIAVLFVSVVVIFQCAAFFTTAGGRIAEDLFIAMICLGSAPQHTQGMVMKLVLFSILPAGFMAILPVHIIRQHDFTMLAGLAIAACAYAALAVGVFHKGLRRYTSATGWQV